MLSAVPNYVNEHLIPFHTTGAVSTVITSTPTLYNADFLITHGFVLPFSVWIQVITALYVFSLFIMIIPKVISKFVSAYKYIGDILRKT